MDLRTRLGKEWLFCDGGTGTILQEKGLKGGELPELLGMCDRIYVMNEGKMVGEFTAEEATQEKIMSAILSSDKEKEVSA